MMMAIKGLMKIMIFGMTMAAMRRVILMIEMTASQIL